MRFTPYLYFKGDCEAALEFYAACGLGSIRDLRRYEGTPMEGRDGGAWGAKVLHSFFQGPSLRLYASDGPDSEPMKGCALLIESDSVGDAERLFELLSAEGRVTVDEIPPPVEMGDADTAAKPAPTPKASVRKKTNRAAARPSPDDVAAALPS